jgi:ankyrin repeat protein
MKGNTALHEACHNGKLDVLKTLLDAGSDVKATTNERETPLHIGVCV